MKPTIFDIFLYGFWVWVILQKDYLTQTKKQKNSHAPTRSILVSFLCLNLWSIWSLSWLNFIFFWISFHLSPDTYWMICFIPSNMQCHLYHIQKSHVHVDTFVEFLPCWAAFRAFGLYYFNDISLIIDFNIW